MLTVARSLGGAVVAAPPAVTVVVPPSLAKTVTAALELDVAVLKSNGAPPRLRVAAELAAKTPCRADRIEIKISRFLEGAIFASPAHQ
jgi:hypothetical protein